jgi:hypothetical protein
MPVPSRHEHSRSLASPPVPSRKSVESASCSGVAPLAEASSANVASMSSPMTVRATMVCSSTVSGSRPADSAPAETQRAFWAMHASVESDNESATDQSPEGWRGIIDTMSATRPARCMILGPPPPTSSLGATGVAATMGASTTS